MMKEPCLGATPEAGKDFYRRQIPAEVVMLNPLRFKEVADYHQTPNLSPSSPISGKEAYQLYMEHTLPLLLESTVLKWEKPVVL